MTGRPASTVSARCVSEAEVTATFPRVHRYLDELLDTYYPKHAHLGRPLRALVDQGRRTPHEFSLPLLVHAAMRGDPGPAVPVAAVHALWWRAANMFDDVTDGEIGTHLYGVRSGAALTAALECGYALPLRALEALPVPEAQRRGLVRDYLDAWTAASDGQVGDLLNRPAEVEPHEVLHVYRHKSGAVYAMACAMAARLAIGADPGPSAAEHITGWTRFGHLLGMLAQFRNDEDDLRSGRREDLRNGTATYLLVHLLHAGSGDRRAHALALLEACGSSAESREELHAMMRTPDVLRPYHAYVGSLREEAHRLIGALAPGSPYGRALADRVESEVGFLPAARGPDGTVPPA